MWRSSKINIWALLFLIYINDLSNCLKLTAPFLYAGDTQIFTSSHDPAKIANN